MAPSNKFIEISFPSLLKFMLLILALWFAYFIRDILAMVFVALIMAATFGPMVDYFGNRGVPRALVIILLYILVIGGLGLFVYFVLPPAIVQLRQLSDILPEQMRGLNDFLSGLRDLASNITPERQDTLNDAVNFISRFFETALQTTVGFFNLLAAMATIFVLSLYLLLEEGGIKKFFVGLLPVKQRDRIVKTATRIGHKLGAWMRGQFLLALVIGIASFIGLYLIGVPYALTLAILAGLFEIVPIIGPIISAIPAIAVGFLMVSPFTGLLVAIFYIALQELENKLLVPYIMNRAVGLNPITIILSLLIGAKLMGIVGVLLAVPVASVIFIILEDWLVFDKK